MSKNHTRENGYFRLNEIRLEDGNWTVIGWTAEHVICRDISTGKERRRHVSHAEFATAKKADVTPRHTKGEQVPVISK